jgi:hypothetical protein
MLIKGFLLFVALIVSGVSYGQDVSYQTVQVQSLVYVQVPTVSFVPVLVQKEVLIHTWEFRPIVIPNFTIYQYQTITPIYYHRPCWFGNPGSYYSNGMMVAPYRY